jgi:hypothetical protein
MHGTFRSERETSSRASNATRRRLTSCANRSLPRCRPVEAMSHAEPQETEVRWPVPPAVDQTLPGLDQLPQARGQTIPGGGNFLPSGK